MIALLGKTGKIDSGEILFKGQNVLALNEEQLRDLRCREIGVIPNNPKGMLHPIVPIGTQLENRYRSAHPTAKKEQARARAIQALEMVQIPDPVKRLAVLPGELSGGMAQRVLIAMALINEPNLVIADDATTGLDVTVQSQILDLIEAQVQRTGSAAVMVTHDLGIVAQYCKKVAILCMGKSWKPAIRWRSCCTMRPIPIPERCSLPLRVFQENMNRGWILQKQRTWRFPPRDVSCSTAAGTAGRNVCGASQERRRWLPATGWIAAQQGR